MGQQIQQDGLADQGIGAGDQRLGGDDGRRRANQHREGTQHLRQHQEERVQILHRCKGGVAPAQQDPGALAQVVQDQAELHKRPAEIDVLPAHVAHVGIQSLRAGGGQEDAAQDHEAGLVVGTQKHLHGIEGVEGPQHRRQSKDLQETREPQKAEPEQHHRAEGLADLAGAGPLGQKEQGDDEQGDEHHRALAAAQKAVHGLDAAQTFHRRGDSDGRGQHPVGKQCRAPQHGREDEPPAAVFYQRVEGEDAALAVVVRLHGNENIFEGGEQGDGPDDQGQRADDEALVHLGDAAVALQDGLHHVHGGGTDVPVYDADGHKEETETEALLLLGVHTRVCSFDLILQWQLYCRCRWKP